MFYLVPKFCIYLQSLIKLYMNTANTHKKDILLLIKLLTSLSKKNLTC